MYSSKSLLAVAILLACGTIGVSARPNCPKACTLEFNQVCATNGKEYRMFSNPCMMDVFNCEHESLWSRTKSLEPCLIVPQEQESKSVEEFCYKPCTFEYMPVCGFNGEKYQTFGNLCDMNNAHCDDGKVWSVSTFAECETNVVAVEECRKPCTFDYVPVCGFNGEKHQMFGNLCDMNNAHCDDNKVWSVSNFADCEIPTEIAELSNQIDECVRPCGVQYEPICAFDGEKYELFDNACDMHNAECGTDKHFKPAAFTACVFLPTALAIMDPICSKPCPSEEAPVCGYNGFIHQPFHNLCELQKAHCQDTKGDWHQTTFDKCLEFASVEEKTLNCEKPCNKMYKPVCGFNGATNKIFSNQCMLENEHCKDGHNWKIAPMQTCELRGPMAEKLNNKKFNCIKPCNKMYAPVCGTDGQQFKVFGNECVMENEHCNDHHEWKATTFALCDKPQQIKSDIVKACPLIYAPVCATDGQTYKVFDNKCMLEYAQEADEHQWKEIAFALCENPIPLSAAPTFDKYCEKPCNKMLSPVCGTDGQQFKVFNNECIMKNEHCKDNHEWSATTFSHCVEQIKTNIMKACPLIYAPVCATDGQTYKMFDNKCMLESAQEADEHQWKEIAFALCENPIPLAVAPKTNCPMICPLIYQPICAFNGQTHHVFGNDCELKSYNCQNNEHFMATLMDDCEVQIEEIKDDEETYACPDNYLPECGFDGSNYKVFENECMLNAFNRIHKMVHFSHVDLSFCSNVM